MSDRAEIRITRADEIDPLLLREAAEVIERGGLIAFPTGSLYGLGADALNPAAVSRIYKVKRREARKPILILVKHREEVLRYAARITPQAERLMQRFWPGGITLIFDAGPDLPPVLTGGTGKIGIRVPAHPVAAALSAALAHPLTATSANLAGRPGARSVQDMDPKLLEGLDLVVDAGPLPGGLGSSVVDCSGRRLQILREGTIPVEQILATCGE